MELLAQNTRVNQIFGRINSPTGNTFSDPYAALSLLFTSGIRLVFLFGAITMLIYLLWGAFDWITSSGDKDALTKGRTKMTNAVMGMIMLVIAFVLFGVVAGDILGIVKKDAAGNWNFNIPTIGGPGAGGSSQQQAPQGPCVVYGGFCHTNPNCCNTGATNYSCRDSGQDLPDGSPLMQCL